MQSLMTFVPIDLVKVMKGGAWVVWMLRSTSI